MYTHMYIMITVIDLQLKITALYKHILYAAYSMVYMYTKAHLYIIIYSAIMYTNCLICVKA